MTFPVARVTAAIDAAVDGTTHIQLHDGPPGPNGTDNVASGFVNVREAFVFPAASNGTTVQEATFTVSGPGGPYSDATGWDAASGGTLQWSTEVTPAESFAGSDGSLDVEITATASNA